MLTRYQRRWKGAVVLTFFAGIGLRVATVQAQPVNVEVAKKEGKVVLYGTVVPQAMESIFKSFEAKFGVKVEYWRASGNGVMDRAANEWRAGRPGFDVVEGNPGLNAILKTEGAFAKNFPPSAEKFPEQFKDKDGMLIAWRLIPISILFNTELVKPADQPKTLDDLLAPKWKGKLSIPNPIQHAETSQFLWNLRKLKGDRWLDFANALAKQEPLLVESFAPVPNKIVSGEARLGLGYIKYLKQYKGPLGYVLLDKHLSDPNVISVGSKAANPNAARLYVEYLCSNEGQKLVAEQGEFTLFPGVLPPIKDAEKVIATTIMMDRPSPEEFKKLNAEFRPIFLGR
jgi:iron(III) transport system substrate-binding protein